MSLKVLCCRYRAVIRHTAPRARTVFLVHCRLETLLGIAGRLQGSSLAQSRHRLITARGAVDRKSWRPQFDLGMERGDATLVVPTSSMSCWLTTLRSVI